MQAGPPRHLGPSPVHAIHGATPVGVETCRCRLPGVKTPGYSWKTTSWFNLPEPRRPAFGIFNLKPET